MNEFDRHILKGPNYAGTAAQLQKQNFYRPIAPLHTLKLQDSSPVQVCRICRGNRAVGNHHSNNLVDFERCHWCGGLGSYDVRKLEHGK